MLAASHLPLGGVCFADADISAGPSRPCSQLLGQDKNLGMLWYEPGEDTYALIDLLMQEGIAGRIVVDLGCSTGAITEVLERSNFVISCDLNADALREMSRTSRPRLARNIVRTDLLGGINQDCIDVVVFNPPYVPDFDCPILGGGTNGRAVIDRFVASVTAPLVYLLVIEANKPLEVIRNITLRGYKAAIVGIRRVVGETIVIIKAQQNISNGSDIDSC